MSAPYTVTLEPSPPSFESHSTVYDSEIHVASRGANGTGDDESIDGFILLGTPDDESRDGDNDDGKKTTTVVAPAWREIINAHTVHVCTELDDGQECAQRERGPTLLPPYHGKGTKVPIRVTCDADVASGVEDPQFVGKVKGGKGTRSGKGKGDRTGIAATRRPPASPRHGNKPSKEARARKNTATERYRRACKTSSERTRAIARAAAADEESQ